MSFATPTDNQSHQTVTAFFEDRTEAAKAKADLLAAGFADGDIHILEGDEAQANAAPHKDVGIFRALLNIFVFMPEDERATYEEGLRRGGVAVAVHTGPDSYERAIDILDRDGAVNLDERETAWKAEGWAPSRAGVGTSAETTDSDGFEQAQSHDRLVNPAATKDVRERLGTGTADPTVGLDIAPESAVSPGPERTPIPGEGLDSVTARRDEGHGRNRVRSYIGTVANLPTGVDPSI